VSCHPVIGSWAALVRSCLFCPYLGRYSTKDLPEAYGLALLGGNIPALLIPSSGDITEVLELVPYACSLTVCAGSLPSWFVPIAAGTGMVLCQGRLSCGNS